MFLKGSQLAGHPSVVSASPASIAALPSLSDGLRLESISQINPQKILGQQLKGN